MNERSALSIMEIAEKPVVFSHSNPRTLNSNHRNITYAIIDACSRPSTLAFWSYWFPTEFGYDDNYYRASAFVPPEKVPELMNELSTRGYSDEDIQAIWGGNFLRVASECWKA
jgi:microsomal dipeptidase-like Zn-dependent dipeptidase